VCPHPLTRALKNAHMPPPACVVFSSGCDRIPHQPPVVRTSLAGCSRRGALLLLLRLLLLLLLRLLLTTIVTSPPPPPHTHKHSGCDCLPYQPPVVGRSLAGCCRREALLLLLLHAMPMLMLKSTLTPPSLNPSTPQPPPPSIFEVVIAYLTNPLWLGCLLLDVAGGAAMVGALAAAPVSFVQLTLHPPPSAPQPPPPPFHTHRL
jgi:hypothetical protein